MDYKIINNQQENTLREIVRRIHRLQSGGTLDSLRNIGADTGHQIGASYVSLKELASHYEPDETIAFLLWNQKKREEQIVACFLFPITINKEKITQLAQDALNFEIAGYLGSVFLVKHPLLPVLAETWLDNNEPHLQAATLTAAARYLILNPQSDSFTKETFKRMVEKSYPNKYVQLIAERYRFNN